jgi:hypothetical protein
MPELDQVPGLAAAAAPVRAERIIDEECSRVHAAPQDLRDGRLPAATAREVRRRIVERVYFTDRRAPMPRHFEVTNQILGRMIGTSKASVDCLRLRIRKGA